MRNLKSRNLLTAILALLCAVVLALGVSFMLPKTSNISADASTQVSAEIDVTGITLAHADLAATPSAAGTYPTTTSPVIQVYETAGSKNANTGTVDFKVRIKNVPANASWKVTLTFDLSTQRGGTNNLNENSTGLVTGNAYILCDGTELAHAVTTSIGNDRWTDFTASGSTVVTVTNSSTTAQDVLTTEVFQLKGEVGQVSSTNHKLIASLTSLTAEVDNISLPVGDGGTTTQADYVGAPLSLSMYYDHSYAEPVSVTGTDLNGNALATPISMADIDLTAGVFKPTLAGEYTITFKLTDLAGTDNIKWLDDTDGTQEIYFTVNRQKLTVPAINDNEQTYNGTAFEFYFNGSYKSTLMDFTWSDGLSYSTTDQKFTATNAGTYNVYVTLKDTKNYAWNSGSSTDLAQKTLPITINKKELSITARPSDTSLSWQKRAAGTITLTPTVCTDEDGVDDTVSLYVYYLNSAGLDYHSPAVTGHVLDVSKITSTGTYTLCAKLIQAGETDYSADNANYVISTNGGVWEMTSTFEITASGIEAEDLTWYYQKTGDSWPSPLMGSDGQIKLEYSPDLNYTITADGNANVINFAYNGDGFVNGYKTEDSNGNPVIGGACDVGKYTTYVAVEITNTTEFAFDSQHILDGNSKYGWLALDWEISPRELDFADAEWEYTTDGGTTWTAFNQGGVQVDPEYTNLPILIRISPDYITGLGLDPDTDITITYQTNSKKDRGDYTATAEIEISNPSYCTPETADGSDYKITFDWSITNKKIQIKNWNGSQTVTLSNGKAFSVPSIITSDGLDHSSALTYTYECEVDGQTRTATSLDALKAILEAANVSDSNPLTVKISVAVKSTQQDSFTLAGNTTTTCELGDSKDVITVWLENETSEYGNVQFILHAEDKDGTDYLQYITITLSSVLLSDPVGPVQGSNYSALLEYLTKTGTYSLAFELSGLYATGFLLDPTTLTFEITPKQVYVPTVSREIVFTGENIKLTDYLDGYDPTLMTVDALEKRDAGTVYTATITLTDVLNYVFVMRPADNGSAEATKTAVRYTLAGYEKSVEFANDEHTAALLKWQINPYVLDSSLWSLKGSEGAVLNLPSQFAAMLANGTLDLNVGYRYYEDAAGGVIDPVFKPGSTFYADAFLEGADASNFVFENGTIVSDKVTYTVPSGGITAFMSNVKDFVTKSWLGLPIWAWLLIGLALLILLIIIIAVACKRRKSKEEKQAIKERKEEEKARREEERQLQREKLEAERELAKAKQEAELEKIRAQAGLAGMGMAGVGMASMAMQQQPQPQQPQQMPQQMPQQQQQAQSQNDVNARLLAEMRAQMAEFRAAASTAQQPVQMPSQQPVQAAGSGGGMSAGEMMAMMFAQFAGMKADNADKEIAALKSDKEIAALKTEIEIMKLKMEHLKDGNAIRIGDDKQELTPEFLGAVIASAVRSNGILPQTAQPAAIPQSVEESTQSSHAQYPSDAVITTTTTVDTTKPTRKGERGMKSERSDFTDVDGFYDNADY